MTAEVRYLGVAILAVASLAVLAAFQLWTVAAAVGLLIAGLVLYESLEQTRVEKLESRISLIQVSGEDFAEKVFGTLDNVSDAVNMLRGELRQVATNLEGRVAAFEQRHLAEVRETQLDTQKYYDLVQKVIELENKVSSLMHRSQEPSV